jgi:tetratricopeptide (TPR) repeat protein
MRSTSVVMSACLLLSVSSVPEAWGQSTSAASSPPAAGLDAAPSEGAPSGSTPQPLERRERARDLFERGKRSYEAGDFQEALRLWLQCHELVESARERTRLAWSVAQAYRKSGQCELAKAKYREYLEAPANEEAREDARFWFEQLKAECPTTPRPSVPSSVQVVPASSTSAPRVPPASPDHAEPSDRVPPWVVWALFGASAVAAGASLGFAVASHGVDEDVRELARGFRGADDAALSPIEATLGDELASREQAGQRYNTMAWVLGGSSLVLSGVAVTLLLLPGANPERPSATLSAHVNAGLVVMEYRAGF